MPQELTYFPELHAVRQLLGVSQTDNKYLLNFYIKTIKVQLEIDMTHLLQKQNVPKWEIQ